MTETREPIPEKLEYVGGGYFRDARVPKEEKARIVHGPELLQEVERLRAVNEKLLKALASLTDGGEPIVDNPDEGQYCFYCGVTPTYSLHGSDYVKHATHCEWLLARTLTATPQEDRNGR